MLKNTPNTWLFRLLLLASFFFGIPASDAAFLQNMPSGAKNYFPTDLSPNQSPKHEDSCRVPRQNPRDSSSVLTVFIQEDPLRDGYHWYGFVGGDPVNYVDPAGYDAWSAFTGYTQGAAVGGALGFAIGAGLASPVGWVAGGTAAAAIGLAAYSGYNIYDTFSSGAFEQMTGDDQDQFLGSVFGGVVGGTAFGPRGFKYAQSRTQPTPPPQSALSPPKCEANSLPVANHSPDFIISPNGTAFPVPKGATGPTPSLNLGGKQTGVAFTGGSGGANGKVSTMRIMDPTPARGKNPGYPNGYIKYDNANKQGVDPYIGKTLPNSLNHFPIE